MIIIGEKINGSIPSVGRAIAARDEDWIRHLARIQTEAGADYLDVCASVEESLEVETLKWLIDLVQEVPDVPICIDSPSPRSCVAALPFCKKPGIINSVSLEGDKINVVFPVIAGTKWGCVALLCDGKGIPRTAERRLEVFEATLKRAEEFNISADRLYIDPLVVALATDESALTTFAEVAKAVRQKKPEIHITSGLSNISFGLPVRKAINQAFMVLAINGGMDSAIVDPTNRDMMGVIYAAEALVGLDEYCMEYISAYRADRFGPIKEK
jgi:5-methyltetrahydrofolate--homocysteine methyltransferase